MPRPLKTFIVEGNVSHAPQGALKALGVPSHIQQASLLVVARTKKDAAQFLVDAGDTGRRPEHLRETSWNYVTALQAATGFLTHESNVVALRSMGQGPIAVAFGGQWSAVGEFTHRHPDTGKYSVMPIFVPSSQSEPVKPVRITIELDADTDPVVIEDLRASAALHIMASLSGATALGKVVKS